MPIMTLRVALLVLLFAVQTTSFSRRQVRPMLGTRGRTSDLLESCMLPHGVTEVPAMVDMHIAYDLSSMYVSSMVDAVSIQKIQSLNIDWNAIISKSWNRAVSGGVAGASAASIQVLSLMWLRTSLNYQYRFGGSLSGSINKLYGEGGVPRLYRGLPFALIQGPLSRFGDTAANIFVQSAVQSLDPTNQIPIAFRTGIGSLVAGGWRIFLMPVDTLKTNLQVNGGGAWTTLKERVKGDGIVSVLYAGSLASAAATAVGHYPWFTTYNLLTERLPTPPELLAYLDTVSAASSTALVAVGDIGSNPVDPSMSDSAEVLASVLRKADPRLLTLLRSAFIGLCASSISDLCSNSLRVLKTAQQTQQSPAASESPDNEARDGARGSDVDAQMPATEKSGYVDIARRIIAAEGLQGLFTRGLETRILANALQGMLFSVLFKYFDSGATR